MYEFIYTGLGQSIAAYAPNAVFASLVNPLVLGTLISFCGVLVPYNQIQVFWRYTVSNSRNLSFKIQKKVVASYWFAALSYLTTPIAFLSIFYAL